MTSSKSEPESLNYQVNGNQMSEPAPIILDELQELFGWRYDIAIKVILKYEIDLNKVAWYGLTELRDINTHLANAVNSNDENEVRLEMKYANEHLRRAALETLHEYASDMFTELKPRLGGSTFKYRLLMLPPPDPKRVRELKERAQKHLLEARLSRGTDWVKSVDNFYEAINDLKTLSEEVPPISDVRWRTFQVIGVILAILSSMSIYDLIKMFT